MLVMGAFIKRAGPDCCRLLLLLGRASEALPDRQQRRQRAAHAGMVTCRIRVLGDGHCVALALTRSASSYVTLECPIC
jgi:hypothetical protein